MGKVGTAHLDILLKPHDDHQEKQCGAKENIPPLCARFYFFAKKLVFNN